MTVQNKNTLYYKKYLLTLIKYRYSTPAQWGYNFFVVFFYMTYQNDEMPLPTGEWKSATIHMVTLRMRPSIVAIIDKERSKFSTPRSSWITQAVVEKLQKMGYEID